MVYHLKAKRGQFRFNLAARNGQIILQSGGYKSDAGGKNGIESVKTNSTIKAQYDKRKAKNGLDYFVQLAGNKEPIGRSEMYKSKSITGLTNGRLSDDRKSPESYQVRTDELDSIKQGYLVQ